MSQALSPFGDRESTLPLALAPEARREASPLPRLRLSFVDIDGFGALSNVRLDELDSPLTVLLGPNEVGKSTLFDFVTAVLFGFPSRRADERYHAPVAGGPHGGRIGLRASDGEWVVERHASPRKRLSVLRPDGSTGEEEDLARLLGGANVEVFRAVFAVDLDDLSRGDGMSSDEVREVLFSSSILGQRRSAARALRELDARKELLVKPRQGGSANALVSQLREARARLHEARRETEAFEAMRLEADRLSAELEDRRRSIDDTHLRLRHLDALIACREIETRREEAAERLAQAAPLTAKESTLLAHEGHTRRLGAELSGHLERVGRSRELASQRAALEASVARSLGELGAWADGVARDEGFDQNRLRESISPSLERLSDAEIALSAARVSRERAERECEELRSDRREASSGSDMPAVEETAMRLVSLRELRSWLLRIEQLEQEARYQAAEHSRPSADPRRPTVLAMAAAALALAATAAWWMASGRLAGGAVALFVLALLLVAAVGLVGFRLLRPGTGGAAEDHDLRAGRARELADARRAAFRLRTELLLDDGTTSSVTVQRLIDETEVLAERRRKLDGEMSELAAGRQRVTNARREEEEALALRDVIVAEIAARAAAAGLPAELPAAELTAVIDRLGRLAKELSALGRLEAALESHDRQVESFRREVATLCGSLGLVPPDDDESLKKLFDELAFSLTTVKEREAARSQLEEVVLGASREIDRALGGGEQADALRRELSMDRVLDWGCERESLRASVEELKAGLEEAVRQHERLARRLSEIACSEEIARLEQEVLELDEALQSDLAQFLVVATARLLVQRTLRRYEDERQPAVLERAGGHFSRVTGGRYVRLAVDSGVDASKPSLRVLEPSGQSLDAVDLSRGTREQLYLCLRLALAETFAERYVPLPIVLDDVIVNFDPRRQESVVDELAETAAQHQVLFLTCHPRLAELILERTGAGCTRVIELGESSGVR